MTIKEIKLQEGISDTSLTAYLQDPLTTNTSSIEKPAVIICPGGAYLGYSEKEAEPVAIRFLSEGYQAFILRYSIGDTARFPAPVIDAAKAIMLVREHAREWCIHPDKISLCGFSTGAHVAAALGAMWQKSELARALNTDNHYFKPNALLLGYPILNLYRFGERNREHSQEMNTLVEMMFSCVFGCAVPDKSIMMDWDVMSNITSVYPSTFLWTTMEDSFVDVEQSMDFIKCLAAQKVPYEFHVFEKGPHGSSIGSRTAGFPEDEIKKLGNTPQWVGLALHWLEERQK
jgi:acetyl esterase/lipase